jgi:GntR family transcriptional repressor for pyruvate dehydrogenase complex
LGELKAEGLYEARSVIEVSLTEMAAARATPEDLQAIQDALHAMREMAHDTPAFVQADLEFHIAVARAGHNDLLAQFYQLAHTLLLEATQHLVSLPNVKAQSIEIQSAILHAIEQGNPQEARRAAQKHMHYIQQLMIKP